MYKKYTYVFLLALIALGPIGQFIIFKFTPVFSLSLLGNLYDDAFWVKGRPKVLIMGSSHARYHIVPSEIANMSAQFNVGDIVNIGENAASPFRMYTAYQKRKEKFSEVEIVYYTLEPHMFGEKYYPYDLYERIFLSYEQWEYLENNHNKKNSYFFPFQLFVDLLQTKRHDRSKTQGYSALKHKNFKPYSSGKVSKLIYEPIELFPVSLFKMNYLKKLKDEIESHGAKFVFILTPTYSWQQYYKGEAKIYDDNLINILNEKLGDTVVLGSFWSEDFNLVYSDFKDDTHLARSGAVTMTRRIFGDIDRHKDIVANKIINTYDYRIK